MSGLTTFGTAPQNGDDIFTNMNNIANGSIFTHASSVIAEPGYLPPLGFSLFNSTQQAIAIKCYMSANFQGNVPYGMYDNLAVSRSDGFNRYLAGDGTILLTQLGQIDYKFPSAPLPNGNVVTIGTSIDMVAIPFANTTLNDLNAQHRVNLPPFNLASLNEQDFGPDFIQENMMPMTVVPPGKTFAQLTQFQLASYPTNAIFSAIFIAKIYAPDWKHFTRSVT